MQDAREELYILLEESYVLREKSKDILNFNEKFIFPYDWYTIKDYKTKIDILLESMENNQLIIDTEGYMNLKK